MTREFGQLSFQQRLDQSAVAKSKNVDIAFIPTPIISSPEPIANSSLKNRIVRFGKTLGRAAAVVAVFGAPFIADARPVRAQTQNGESITSADPTNPREEDADEESQDVAQGVPGRPTGSPAPVASPDTNSPGKPPERIENDPLKNRKINREDNSTWRMEKPVDNTTGVYGQIIYKGEDGLYALGEAKTIPKGTKEYGMILKNDDRFKPGEVNGSIFIMRYDKEKNGWLVNADKNMQVPPFIPVEKDVAMFMSFRRDDGEDLPTGSYVAAVLDNDKKRILFFETFIVGEASREIHREAVSQLLINTIAPSSTTRPVPTKE